MNLLDYLSSRHLAMTSNNELNQNYLSGEQHNILHHTTTSDKNITIVLLNTNPFNGLLIFSKVTKANVLIITSWVMVMQGQQG